MFKIFYVLNQSTDHFYSILKYKHLFIASQALFASFWLN